MENEIEKEQIYGTDLKDKIFIVTGANSGIGKEITLGLAKMNAKVVMMCRSKERGTTAMNQIKKDIPSANLKLMICDLSDFSQVRDFAERYKNKYSKLDGLINNAGIYLGDYKESVDGVSVMMQVNHFSPFLLTHLLLDSLKASDFSRIINVNSGAHYRGEIEISEVSKIKEWKKTGMKGYSISKFVNLLTIYKFNEELEDTHVTINAYNPGMTNTNLPRHSLGAKIMWKIISPFIKSAREGAEPLIYLISNPKFDEISGKYYDLYTQKKSSTKSYDEDLQEAVWKESMSVTGLIN